ncbi:MAG TPA: alpha/beta hydrolase [Anaerolineales bacterium]
MDCELKDITVHYELLGEGRPIILFHGWGLNHRSMMSDMEPLFRHRDGWMRIYPDLPGHGRTPGKDWIMNQDKVLDVMLDFIDHVIPGERLVVAGGSAGAYLARGVAYRKPALIDGLLLVAPLIVADDAKRTLPAHVTLVEDQAVFAQLEAGEAEVIRELAVVQGQKWVDLLKVFSDPAGGAGDPEFQANIREHAYAFSFDVDALSEPCPAPTLIVAGRQDSVVGYRDAWEIFENYPRGTFAVLDRAGHGLTIEQEELFQVLVNEWLNRVEEYAGMVK